jgi:hypothetical protein
MTNIASSTFRENSLAKKLFQVADGVRLKPFAGFLVRSEDDKKIRLYKDLSLTTYLELDENDILHVVDSENDTEPSVVYLKETAQSVSSLKVVTTMEDLKKPQPDPWAMGGDALAASLAATYIPKDYNSWKDCEWEPKYQLVFAGIEQGTGNPIYKKVFVGFHVTCPWWK